MHRRLRQAVAAVWLAAGFSIGSGAIHPAPAQTRHQQTSASSSVPMPHAVHSRATPLKTARTALVHDTAPFPFSGELPHARAATSSTSWTASAAATAPAAAASTGKTEHQRQSRPAPHPPGLRYSPAEPHHRVFPRPRRHPRHRQAPEDPGAAVAFGGQRGPGGAAAGGGRSENSSIGKLWRPGAFARFLGEAARELAKLHGDPKSAKSFAGLPVVVVGYSGGYLATAWSLKQGGIGKRLRGVVLFDAMYGEMDTFERWIERDRSAFFVSSFTSSTRSRNLQLGRTLAARDIPVAGDLTGRMRPGSVSLLEGQTDATHRDFLTYAWTEAPLKDVLVRLAGYQEAIPQPKPATRPKLSGSSARVDDDRLARHGAGFAHGHDLRRAVVLVGGLLQERRRRRALDLGGQQVRGRARALEQPRRDAVHQHLGRQGHGHAAGEMDETRLRHGIGNRRARRRQAGDEEMRPSPCCFITGATALISSIGPVRFTSMIFDHTSCVRLSRSGNGIDLL